MKISVCMIAWNEEEIIDKAIKSTEGLADEVIVVDTGSSDGTVEICKELGAKTFTGADRMNKGESRNRAIEESSGDWVVILDADEQIAQPKALRKFLETTDADAVYIKLAYVDGEGNHTLSYAQMRVWKRNAYRYKYRAHEVPTPTNGWGKLVHTDFIWEHRPPKDRTWKSDYTLNRLLLDVKENPGNARPVYYLGRQYMYRQEWELALENLNKYLESPGVDKADAWHCLAKCYKGLGQEDKQIEMLFMACASRPGRREWWGELAEIHHAKGNDNVAIGLLKCALEQPMPPKSYIRHYWYGAHIYDLLARCLWKLEKYEEGYDYMSKAVELEPSNQRLKTNLEWFERKLGLVPATKIFITGCAKSGTTLLRRLFYAFKDVEIIPNEQLVTRFCQRDSFEKFMVGKRHRFSLFSEHLAPSLAMGQVQLIKKHNVKIVNVIRDGRDVIFSDHMNVEPRRWVAAMRQRSEYSDLIDMEVRYEDIVTNPDNVQEQVAQKLGLEIKHLWSEYPDFVPEYEFADGIYAKRPLDTSSVGRGVDYRILIEDVASGFDSELKTAGYASPMDKFYRRKGPDVHNRKRHKEIAKLVEGPVVLDVGCGTGDLLLQLQGKNGLTLYGVDISQVALDMARRRGVGATLYRRDKLPPLDCNTIVMSQILEHLDDDREMVEQAKNCLVPGGLLVASVPREDKIPSPDHRRDYTEESLKTLLGIVGEPELHSWSDNKYRILMTVRNGPASSTV
jgi:glycosyltransferase involved in cell wall biosynthesis